MINAVSYADISNWMLQHQRPLDTASSGGKADGFISHQDLNTYLSKADKTGTPAEVQAIAADETQWNEFLSSAAGPIATARDNASITLFDARNARSGLGNANPGSPASNAIIAPPEHHDTQPDSGAGKLAILAYSPWHAYQNMAEHHAGITPDIRDANGNLMPYDPMNRAVLEWDLQNFQNAGITTLALDWSNNSPVTEGQLAQINWDQDTAAHKNSVLAMEMATEKLAQFYSEKQSQGIQTPKLSIIIGVGGAGDAAGHQAKADQVKRLMERHPGVFQILPDEQGVDKPLLIKYNGPSDQAVAWSDPSLNVVSMSAYNDYFGRNDLAAWEQHTPTSSEVNGQTWITLNSANRGLTGWEDSRERNTRENGATLARNAETVVASGADVMFIQSYYEGTDYEELDAEHTNDLIPSVENGSADWAKVSDAVARFLNG